MWGADADPVLYPCITPRATARMPGTDHPNFPPYSCGNISGIPPRKDFFQGRGTPLHEPFLGMLNLQSCTAQQMTRSRSSRVPLSGSSMASPFMKPSTSYSPTTSEWPSSPWFRKIIGILQSIVSKISSPGLIIDGTKPKWHVGGKKRRFEIFGRI